MTVGELMERLRALPADMPVLVEGYESGWDGIFDVRTTGVVSYRKANEWDGEYREASEFKQVGHAAVLLVGRRGGRR